jgi:hypothetical protein
MFLLISYHNSLGILIAVKVLSDGVLASLWPQFPSIALDDFRYSTIDVFFLFVDTVTGKTTAGTGRMNAKAASPATRSLGFTSLRRYNLTFLAPFSI